MASKKYPWWKPTGRDAYVGVVLFHGDKVLLRRLNSKGYRWTFPRRKIREEHIDIEYYNACDLAEAMGAQLRRVVAIPGTWRGEASVAQYWRANAISFTPPAQHDAIAEAEAAFGNSTEQHADAAGKFIAAGLPLSQCGKPLPLSPDLAAFFIDMAAELPSADLELPPGDDLEWAPVSAVAHHLAQSESKRGRRRDIAVWHAAQAVGRVTKPTEITGLGWTKQTVLGKGSKLLSVSAQREEDLNAWPFTVPLAPIQYHMRATEALQAATKAGWRLQACFTCRHLECSGMATEAGGGWCTAARAPDDERRAEIPDALGWCSTYEAALLSRGGVEVRRDGPRTPKEATWSFVEEKTKQVDIFGGLGPGKKEPLAEPMPLMHSTFITSRLFSRLRPSFGIRLVPAERVVDQIGPGDRSYVCIGDYNEVKGHSVREVANCFFGIDQPWHSADGNLVKKYAYPGAAQHWPPAWRVFLVRLHDDTEVDLFPGTWKSAAYILQDPARMSTNAALHQAHMEAMEGRYRHMFQSKEATDFLELDAEMEWGNGSQQRTWYEYIHNGHPLVCQLIEALGIKNSCWHGRGYIGTAPAMRARVFLMRNLAASHEAVQDLGVLSADAELAHGLEW